MTRTPKKWKDDYKRLHLKITLVDYIKLKKLLKIKDRTMQEEWEDFINKQIN